MSQKGRYTTGVEWPLQIRARYAEVLSNPGIHYTFTTGTKFRSDPGYGFFTLPMPYYNGYVFRVFMYAGDNSEGSYTGIHYKSGGHEHWTIRVAVEGGQVFVFKIEQSIFDTENKSSAMGTVKEGDVYTISLVTASNKYFHAYFNDNHIGTLDVTTIRGFEYRLWHRSRTHTLLSMHFSRESGTETNLGSELFLQSFHMPIGSYVTYDCVYNPTADKQNIVVYIRDRSNWTDGVTWTFMARDQELGGRSFTCSVRRLPSDYVVFISFQSTPEQVAHNPRFSVNNRLEVSFSSNVQQVRSHHVIPF